MERIYSAKYNSLKVGDTVNVDDKEYIVKGISLRINFRGGTDYIIDDKPKGFFQKLFKK